MSRNALFELRTKHAELLEKKTEQRIEELVKQGYTYDEAYDQVAEEGEQEEMKGTKTWQEALAEVNALSEAEEMRILEEMEDS
jgi:hypothetical protein